MITVVIFFLKDDSFHLQQQHTSMAFLVLNENRNNQPLVADRFSNGCNDHNCANSGSSHRRRKRVHFHYGGTAVHAIQNRETYTPEEVAGYWYTSRERRSMRKSLKVTLDRMESGKIPLHNTSYRGLEKWVKVNSSELDGTIYACIDAVIDEQERQRKSDTFDWGKFREASLKVSSYSMLRAYSMAAFDEKRAYEAYASMTRESREVERGASFHNDVTETKSAQKKKEDKNKTKEEELTISGSRKALGSTFRCMK